MQGPYLRKYGTATTVDFVLFGTDGVDLKTDAAHASGDTTIMKDEGAEANTTNGFTDEGNGYSIALTATEMEAARIVVYVIDQGTKAWLDTALVIETYGNASGQHAFDLDTATVNLSSTTETQIDNIETDTDELQGDWTDGGRLDLLIDAIKAVTDNLPNSGALSDLATILTDTDELQGDWTDGGRLDLLIDAIKAKTDNLPADPADDSDIDSQLATIDGVVDAIKAVTDLLPDSGALSSLATAAALAVVDGIVDTILLDTAELQTDWADGGRLDSLLDTAAAGGGVTAAEIADAVLDEATADHQTQGTVGKALTDAAATLGAGAITFTYTLTSSEDSSPITDADVWVTSDEGGTNVIASGETDSNGQVTFYLDAGTVYVWAQKPGWNFSNPDTEVVA